MNAVGRVLGQRYRLESVLGVGGMGEVWLARHLELGSPVALKLMSPGLLRDTTARTRFRREARAAAHLRSPHLVVVHDFGEDDGTPYLVMEFLAGETLKEALAKAPIAPPEAAAFLEQACAGLGFAHDQGIIHRDIKPSNLFIAESAGQSVLKIIDFGIARALSDEEDADVTRSGAILGSPAFMSPALANGERATAANDLWSMAAVAYWMLLGREPFTGSMMSDTLHRIRIGRFTPPTELDPELPPALDRFFAQAFSLDVNDRFQTAAELTKAFSASLHGFGADSSSAGELSVASFGSGRRAGKFGGRLRLSLLLIAIATVLVVLSSRVVEQSAPQPRTTTLIEPELSSSRVTAARGDRPNASSASSLAASAPRSTALSSSGSAGHLPAALRPNRAPVSPRTAQSSPLTQEPPSVTRSGRDSADPLFGIVVKSPRVGDSSAANGSRADAGAIDQR